MNPLLQKFLQTAVGPASYLAPGICAHLAFQQWFKTHRHDTPKRELTWTLAAKQQHVVSKHGKLNALIWPTDGPNVLLVHGWNGRASQMGAIADPLNDAGFEVIAIDLPGHGASPGNTSSLPVSAQALLDAQHHFGPFHATIGHSFGGAASLLAISQGLQTQAAITIGSPSKLEWLLDLYAEFLNFNPAATQKLAKLLEKKLGADIWQRCDLEIQGPTLTTPGLVIHDTEDKEVPFYHAEMISKAWSAQLLKTTGLGHRRVLRDKKTIAAIVNFILTQKHNSPSPQANNDDTSARYLIR